MDSAKKSRREVFVAHVRTEPSIGRLSVVLSKIASMAILAALVTAAWVVFSFVRTSLAGAPEVEQQQAIQTTRTSEATSQTQLSKREPIVYISAADTTYYHQCGHTPEGGGRQALSASLARSRGIQPCPVCFRR